MNATEEEIDALKPGSQIYIWWDTGAMGATIWYGTVVRVNRKTVTAVMENRDKPSRVPRHIICIPRYGRMRRPPYLGFVLGLPVTF